LRFIILNYLTSLHLVPKSFILARHNSLKLPYSTPEVTKGIGISLFEISKKHPLFLFLKKKHTFEFDIFLSKEEPKKEYGQLNL
jgi:hypothetical protein